MNRPLSQCKVLLVEDVDESRVFLRQLLSRLGVTILEACNGLEGVELARRERPELVLMDISLPLMDGWQAIATLKGDPSTRNSAIIVVSAQSSVEDIHKARTLGCDGYATKPVSVERFSLLVSLVLRGEFVAPELRW